MIESARHVELLVEQVLQQCLRCHDMTSGVLVPLETTVLPNEAGDQSIHLQKSQLNHKAQQNNPCWQCMCE